MSKPLGNEVQQFRMILARHYGISLYSATIAGTGHAAVENFIYVVFEMKAWNGSGDPEVQASLYNLKAMRAAIVNKQKDSLDLLPCIVVYCVGGCLSLPCYPLFTPHRHSNRVFWDGPH